MSSRTLLRLSPALAALVALGMASCRPVRSGPSADAPARSASILELKRRFVNLRFMMFIHFNMSTYENNDTTEDWGSAHADPALFNPVDLDCGQWADAALSAKMRAGCLTVKHHDGFALYPSAYGDYHVAPGRPDVVRAYVDAFRSRGLQPGLYFSMLDLRQHIEKGTCTPEKKSFIKNQLRELLTRYGRIPFLVFDGWNAPWGGPTYEELPFEEIRDFVRGIQPDCLLINISCESNETHTDLVMFENGAGYVTPAWYDKAGVDCYQLQKGYWFWKPSMARSELNSVDFVVDRHLVPLNAQNQNYILNCAPNTRGTLDPNVLARLREIGRAWNPPADLATIPASWLPAYDVVANLAYGKPCRQSSTAFDGHAVRAVDGYTEGRYDHASVSHTGLDPHAWWQVDLLAEHRIGSVEVFNRTDRDSNRLQDFWVFVSRHPFQDSDTPATLQARGDVWSQRVTACPQPSLAVPMGGRKGRYVRIQLESQNFLSLAEVKVTGVPGR